MDDADQERHERIRSIIRSLAVRAEQDEPISGHLRNFVRIVDFEKLSSSNTHIIFGRNGTGKTHLFRAYARSIARQILSRQREYLYMWIAVILMFAP